MISIAMCIIAHFVFPVSTILRYPWNLTGIVPMILGSWLNLFADQAFKKAQTTVKPFEESTHLIKDGAFQFSRNPMYLGMVLILVGTALLLGTVSPFIVAFIFAILMDYRFIRIEEQMLEAKFGEVWLSYKCRVRRWL